MWLIGICCSVTEVKPKGRKVFKKKLETYLKARKPVAVHLEVDLESPPSLDASTEARIFIIYLRTRSELELTGLNFEPNRYNFVFVLKFLNILA